MPELPEVESIRIQLEKFLVSHKIEKVEVKTPKIFSGNPKNLENSKVKKVRRFGKALVIDLSDGYSIVAHLKLTGQFIYRGPKLKKPPELSSKVVGGVPSKHTHVIFNLDKDGKLYYNDVRKFGWIKIVQSSNLKVQNEFLAKLGPEPLDSLTLAKFKEIVNSSKQAVKLLLMDQTKIAGVGNIYANDALWLAKISPKKPAKSLSEKEIKTLYEAILKVLKQGLKQGGASELAFVTPDGKEGQYQKHFLAYGQDGQICKHCKKQKIKKIMLAGRGTYFCPICQK